MPVWQLAKSDAFEAPLLPDGLSLTRGRAKASNRRWNCLPGVVFKQKVLTKWYGGGGQNSAGCSHVRAFKGIHCRDSNTVFSQMFQPYHSEVLEFTHMLRDFTQVKAKLKRDVPSESSCTHITHGMLWSWSRCRHRQRQYQCFQIQFPKSISRSSNFTRLSLKCQDCLS